MVDKLKKFISKEAYLLPIMICLFFIPIFFNPLFINSFTQGKEIFLKLVLSITIIGCSVYAFLRRSLKIKPFHRSWIFLFLVLGAFFSLVSTLFSPTPLISLLGTYHRGFGLITQTYLFCFVLYCSSVLSEKDIIKLLRIVFGISVFIALYGLLQKAGVDPFFGSYDTNVFVGRIFSSLGNPGYFAQYLLLCIGIGSFLFLRSKKKNEKILYFLGLTALLPALWFSQTRTSVLALLLCLVIVAIKWRQNIWVFLKKMCTRQKIIVSVLVFFMIAGAALLPKDRFSLDENALRSINSRLEIWKGAIGLTLKRPLLGYGQETFYVYSPEIITKQFLTLEEDLNLSIDRIHNELLEMLFSYGVFAGIFYVIFFGYLFWAFMKSKKGVVALLLLMVVANMIQNQFSFSDISIAVLIAFCFGGLIADELKNKKGITLKIGNIHAFIAILTVIGIGLLAFHHTVYKPYISQLAYATSRINYDKSYEIAVTEHKKAITYAPDYSELWYELMMLDPSSMGRALDNIERIEGKSGNLLAWKGNYYAEKDPEKASEYYMQALEKNPYYPNWIRSYADMLYRNGDYQNALYLYKVYLEAVPDFWKWKDTLDRRSEKEQTSYRIFFKNVPDFWNTVERVSALENVLMKTVD